MPETGEVPSMLGMPVSDETYASQYTCGMLVVAVGFLILIVAGTGLVMWGAWLLVSWLGS